MFPLSPVYHQDKHIPKQKRERLCLPTMDNLMRVSDLALFTAPKLSLRMNEPACRGCEPDGEGPCTHGQVHGRVDAEGRLLGGEGLAGPHDEVGVAGAGLLAADELRQLLAPQRRVVGLAQGQEVGGQVTRHHLSSIHEDVRGEQSERVDPWKQTAQERSRLLFQFPAHQQGAL